MYRRAVIFRPYYYYDTYPGHFSDSLCVAVFI